MNWLTALLDFIKQFCKDNWQALAALFYNYEEDRVDQAKADAERANEQVQIEKNHEAVDAANAGKSDADIVNDAISNGSGGQSKTDNGSGGSDPKSGSS